MQFTFLAGNPALDFVATIASRDTVAEEKLTSPAELRDWIELTGLVDDAPAVSAADLSAAIELREAVYRAVRAVTDGSSPSRADRELINRYAAHPDPIPALGPQRVDRRGDLAAVLSLLARAAIDAATDDRVRFCDGADCTRPYVDTSRARTRRWCGMAGCGDRAKSAAYRARRRS